MEEARVSDDFEPHRAQVYRWAIRILGQHEDALDVVQDVGLRWTMQCRQAVLDYPQAWLRRVTLNRATDYLRQRARALPMSQQEPQGIAGEAMDAGFGSGLGSGSGSGSGLDPAERGELRSQVAAAVAALSEMQRQVLVGRLWDGLTFEQVASELGIAVPTAKTHYVRALARAASSLAGWGDDAEEEGAQKQRQERGEA